MPVHRKVAPLSDAAFRLHVTASCWCCDEETDGRVPKSIPATLTRAPRGRTLTGAMKELTDAGLWEIQEDGDYVIHDFLVYNPSAAQSKAVRDAKATAGAAGGRAKAGKHGGKNVAPARHGATGEPSTGVADAKQTPSPTRASAGRSDSDSDSESQTATAIAPKTWPDGPVPCPVPLPLDDDAFGGLAELAIDRPVAEAFLRRWAQDQRAAKANPRPIGAWVVCGLKALRGQWSDGSKRAEIRAMAAPTAEPAKPPSEELHWV